MTKDNWLRFVPDEAIYLLNRLNSHGYDAWFVGGCVRDMSLGIMPADYDIATSALPDQVASLFERSLDTGVKHGTVAVILSGQVYEVTTYRSEGPYSDGRRPDTVCYENDIIPDLSRRDFTINSMAWHPAKDLLDPFGGRADLQSRKLRCVGSAAERLTEDALRQLRAVRFSLNYNLDPDDELLQAIYKYHKKTDLLSSERIRTELTRTGWAPYGAMLLKFSGSGLMASVFKRILEIDAPDDILCHLLAGFIQPFWQKEQIWSVFILAGLMAQRVGVIVHADEQGRLKLQASPWQTTVNKLTQTYLSALQSLLVEKTRLSVNLSRHTEAILMLIRLRMSLWTADRRCQRTDSLKKGRAGLRLKLIMRAALRQTHLDQWQILTACEHGWEIMNYLVADEDLHNELSNDMELILRWRNFPDEYRLVPTQLPIRGNDEVFSNLDNKRRIGLYLERLLSYQLHYEYMLESEEARNLIIKWLSK